MSIHNLSFLMFLLISMRFNSISSLFIDRNLNECNHTIEKCGCSINSPNSFRTARILGGEQVTNYQSWPWMVSLRRWGHHVCGGVIISSSFILTAAHCIPSTGLSVALGIIQQSNLTTHDTRIRAITRVYLHSNFSAENLHNDLAILHLEHRLSNQNLTEICLPLESDPLPIDSEVIAIGFGREKESSTRSSDHLRQVKLRLLSPTSQTCKDELTDPYTQFCAGLETSNKGLLHFVSLERNLVLISRYRYM